MSGLYDTNNNSVVSVNGLIITAKDVDIQSGRIDVANGANILAGTKNKTLVNTNSEADNLFNTLVNTSNIHEAESLGNITINSTILGFLDVDPEINMVKYTIDGEPLSQSIIND